ncbi:hypothetical protein psyc5s11_51070 [Clostridium gelidum]|uniref:Cadherin-like beta-sandwich-like domain-containing protein n=1 Tax=Clostridium gelidum TaxID=704125 RepID=A0ABN6J613_9CLOT|nr:cadherin-like beta sandwich domain-containing protein [Clostridium gelidum]BCZ49040.1 hypothetical protein psyc5s11_51070 [Clostridium gelidum]
MNKKIKRIIAVVLTISAFSIIEPTKYMNLTNTVKAHADIVGADLDDISLEKGQMKFNANRTAYSVTLKSTVEKLEIKAKPRESSATVEIDGEKVTSGSDYMRIVKLDKGENKIDIKVTNGSKKKTYTVTIIRGDIEEAKQVYLNSINLSDGEINFSKEVTSYDVNVSSDIKDITIKAKPEVDDNEVEINGLTAYEDDNHKRTVSLNNGKNEIKIKVTDDDDYEKTYTLNVNRGGTSTATKEQTTASNNTTTTTNTNNNVATSTAPVTTVKGWSLNNGQWYYLNEDGTKQIGWKLVNGSWYYLDTNGIMKTGWLKDSNGKWYYLYDSGIMAKSTTIGGYKLNSSGDWIN